MEAALILQALQEEAVEAILRGSAPVLPAAGEADPLSAEHIPECEGSSAPEEPFWEEPFWEWQTDSRGAPEEETFWEWQIDSRGFDLAP